MAIKTKAIPHRLLSDICGPSCDTFDGKAAETLPGLTKKREAACNYGHECLCMNGKESELFPANVISFKEIRTGDGMSSDWRRPKDVLACPGIVVRYTYTTVAWHVCVVVHILLDEARSV